MRKRYCCEKDTTDFDFCEECLKKQLKIDKLQDELRQLKAQLNYRKKKDNQPFGISTPSSKLVFKKNSSEENKKKQGGAKKGHKGYGRKVWDEQEADEVIRLKVEIDTCPDCGEKLESNGLDHRSILDAALVEAKKVLYTCQTKTCRCCQKKVSRQPLVMPRFKYGNHLIANAMVLHYLEGIPLKRLVSIFGNGVSSGGLMRIFHTLAEKWTPTYETLKKQYRQAPVKHADETGWREDGHSGYGWLFCTPHTSLFTFEKTRASRVPLDILGAEPCPGVLIVDRYNGYNRVPCNLQYCYAHLLRDLKKMEKDYPKNKEIKSFVAACAPLLSEAMGLRNKAPTEEAYYHRAKAIKKEIVALAREPASHPAIHTYQSIFIEKAHRLFHWVNNRMVPCENNRAERELRPTVIARKVSFGSQSLRGARTRSVLMSVLHTTIKRLESQTIKQWAVSTLDALAKDSEASLTSLLPQA